MFCRNCGKEMLGDSKFCAHCGTPIIGIVSTEEKRKTVYDGEIHKCPKCGALLKAFETVCPECKYELRGVKGSSVVNDFMDKLLQLKTTQQRIDHIKNYPIPHSREGVREFLDLACANFDEFVYEQNLGVDDESDAWLAKIKQCGSKAESVCANYPIELDEINKKSSFIIAKATTIQRKARMPYQFTQQNQIYNPNVVSNTPQPVVQQTYTSTNNTVQKAGQNNTVKKQKGFSSWSTGVKVLWVILNIYTFGIPALIYAMTK